MLDVNTDRLNALERKVHRKLRESAEKNAQLRIGEAAVLCACSPSKISKMVRKLGFATYKQYIGSFSNPQEHVSKSLPPELARLSDFIAQFDERLVNEMISLFNKHFTIIFFGYGPSFYCLQYFTYKLRIITTKNIIATNDELTAKRLLRKGALLVIFSTTGRFKSFADLNQEAKRKGCEVLLVLEEYNRELLAEFSHILFLTDSFQNESLKPYEKSRAVFFIFIEEVVRKILEAQNTLRGAFCSRLEYSAMGSRSTTDCN
ncbi:MAG: SIS domain-containing protein [Spirochaetaceae bacterium]|jgi:DNA-binding MurR/RpiR family transcriptional regulator|nr:SIS domain-containing protein [Spirochaetaceae bacterium]